MFSGHTIVEYCIMLIFVKWMLHLDTERSYHFSYFFGSMKLYNVVAKLKHCRVPSSDNTAYTHLTDDVWYVCIVGIPQLCSQSIGPLEGLRDPKSFQTFYRDMHTIRKFNYWPYCLALCDEIFHNFTLFDKTLRHIELCNSVISQIQRNPPKLF